MNLVSKKVLNHMMYQINQRSVLVMRTIETENLKLIYFNEDNDEWVEVTEFFNGEWSEVYIMDLDEVLINFGICF